MLRAMMQVLVYVLCWKVMQFLSPLIAKGVAFVIIRTYSLSIIFTGDACQKNYSSSPAKGASLAREQTLATCADRSLQTQQ